MQYRINWKKLNERTEGLDAEAVALLIVISEFNHPAKEEEIFAKVEEYGLNDMSDEELLEWIDNWKKAHNYLLN